MNCECGKIALRGKSLCLTCYMKQQNISTKKRYSHEEDDMQKAFFGAVRLAFPKLGKLIFAVPNGGKRDKKEAVRMKAQGVVAGVSDIICLVPNDKYSFLCLEAKTAKGTQSAEQKEFQKQVEASGGLYLIFRSAMEGIEILKEYLNNN